jgi:superfamily II DNA or RNA helicase
MAGSATDRWFRALLTKALNPDTLIKSHQFAGLAWMLARERLNYYGLHGGLNGKRLGLGKTLEMLLLCLCDRAFASPDPTEKLASFASSAEIEEVAGFMFGLPEIPAGVQRLKTLVVTPLTLVDNWEKEVKARFKPGFWKCVNLSATLKTGQMPTDGDIYLIHYEALANSVTRSDGLIDRLQKMNFARLIMDEAHSVKNTSTNQFKACKMINASRRWAVTATATPNQYHEACAIYSVLRVQHHILTAWMQNKFKTSDLACAKVGLTAAFAGAMHSSLLRTSEHELHNSEVATRGELADFEAYDPVKDMSNRFFVDPRSPLFSNCSRSDTTLWEADCTDTHPFDSYSPEQARSIILKLGNADCLSADRLFVRYIMFRESMTFPEQDNLLHILTSKQDSRVSIATFKELATGFWMTRSSIQKIVSAAASILGAHIALDSKRAVPCDAPAPEPKRSKQEPAVPGIITFCRPLGQDSLERVMYEELRDGLASTTYNQERARASRMGKKARIAAQQAQFVAQTDSMLDDDENVLENSDDDGDAAASKMRQARTHSKWISRNYILETLLLHPDVLRANHDSTVEYIGRRISGDSEFFQYTHAHKIPAEGAARNKWIRDAHTRHVSTKMRMILEYITNSVKPDEKVIVFTKSVAFATILEGYIQDVGGFNCVLLPASSSVGMPEWNKRFGQLRKLPAEQAKVGIFSKKSNGVGLNVPEANHVILADAWFNTDTDMQAAGRLDRLGQTRRIYASQMIIGNTIDWDYLLLAAEKSITNNKVSSSAGLRKTVFDIKPADVPVSIRSLPDKLEWKTLSIDAAKWAMHESGTEISFELEQSGVRRKTIDIINQRS